MNFFIAINGNFNAVILDSKKSVPDDISVGSTEFVRIERMRAFTINRMIYLQN